MNKENIGPMVKQETSIILQFKKENKLTDEDIDNLFCSPTFVQAYVAKNIGEKMAYLATMSRSKLQNYLKEGGQKNKNNPGKGKAFQMYLFHISRTNL